ncbi:zinc finger protein 358-like, partial [Penaeus indicus]|uniref:zinc finger protein 358-like n=1 Tax=Penaeus indicus TaxID=29960 RepID=UPI00300CCDEE
CPARAKGVRVDVLSLQAVGGGGGAAVCPVCGKAFQGRNRRQNLAHHLLTHTGTRPFPCPHCSYRATQKAHLKRHLERRHGQAGERLHAAHGAHPAGALTQGLEAQEVSAEGTSQPFTPFP